MAYSSSKGSSEKKSVGDIIVDVFLKDVEKAGVLPWTMPYNRYSAFNYVNLTQYHGINRLILPFGEYLTMNQIIAWNKSHNTNYRFDAENGVWWEVVFFKVDRKDVSKAEYESYAEKEMSYEDFIAEGNKCFRVMNWLVYSQDGRVMKRRNILRYTRVADRTFFVDPDTGKCLPSRIESGDVSIERYKPQDILNGYIQRSGVKEKETSDVPYYTLSEDTVYMNNHAKSEDDYWSIRFHEYAHSTCIGSRCAREWWNLWESKTGKSMSSADIEDARAKEECIAEIASSMLCSECDIHNFSTSESSNYKNNLAYVQHWKSKIKDWGSSFIYVVSEAEKAYQMIMGADC